MLPHVVSTYVPVCSVCFVKHHIREKILARFTPLTSLLMHLYFRMSPRLLQHHEQALPCTRLPERNLFVRSTLLSINSTTVSGVAEQAPGYPHAICHQPSLLQNEGSLQPTMQPMPLMPITKLHMFTNVHETISSPPY